MERQPKYWICDLCALKKDLHPFKTGNTLAIGLCGWCDHPDESPLTPICDLKTSSNKTGDIILETKDKQ